MYQIYSWECRPHTFSSQNYLGSKRRPALQWAKVNFLGDSISALVLNLSETTHLQIMRVCRYHKYHKKE